MTIFVIIIVDKIALYGSLSEDLKISQTFTLARRQLGTVQTVQPWHSTKPWLRRLLGFFSKYVTKMFLYVSAGNNLSKL
jgi:hypothetical protein